MSESTLKLSCTALNTLTAVPAEATCVTGCYEEPTIRDDVEIKTDHEKSDTKIRHLYYEIGALKV